MKIHWAEYPSHHHHHHITHDDDDDTEKTKTFG